MSRIPDYEKATNAAYEVLKDYEGPFPNIRITKILKQFDNVKLHAYSELSKKYGISVPQLTNEYVPSYHGFTVFNKSKNQWMIFYNDFKPHETCKFTLAHELGHIVLLHTNDDEVDKKEADCFARNLLCPVPMRDVLKLSNPKDYSQCFNISNVMAKITAAWYPNDKYYISSDSYDAVNERIFCYFSGYTLSELYGY